MRIPLGFFLKRGRDESRVLDDLCVFWEATDRARVCVGRIRYVTNWTGGLFNDLEDTTVAKETRVSDDGSHIVSWRVVACGACTSCARPGGFVFFSCFLLFISIFPNRSSKERPRPSVVSSLRFGHSILHKRIWRAHESSGFS